MNTVMNVVQAILYFIASYLVGFQYPGTQPLGVHAVATFLSVALIMSGRRSQKGKELGEAILGFAHFILMAYMLATTGGGQVPEWMSLTLAVFFLWNFAGPLVYIFRGIGWLSKRFEAVASWAAGMPPKK